MNWTVIARNSGSSLSVHVPDEWCPRILDLLHHRGRLYGLDPYRDLTVSADALDPVIRALDEGLDESRDELARQLLGRSGLATLEAWESDWIERASAEDGCSRLLEELRSLFELARDDGLPVRMSAD
jgi:hypothetical protein